MYTTLLHTHPTNPPITLDAMPDRTSSWDRCGFWPPPLPPLGEKNRDDTTQEAVVHFPTLRCLHPLILCLLTKVLDDVTAATKSSLTPFCSTPDVWGRPLQPYNQRHVWNM
ncbi:hypothetical protein E2C01_006270 [Portunus trituberculatus]|uniref:Uncharacterized protein n=1 Tax=Portunus trituberculatus TaxID=210409 RepID=A0A5B7CUS0_PORTR|nr:hypothetical protein [Portunus trituberculatus]